MWKCPHSTYYLNICCENKIKAMGWTVLGGKFQYQRDMKSCSSEANIKYVVRDEIYISNLIWGKYQISSEIYIYFFSNLRQISNMTLGRKYIFQIWDKYEVDVSSATSVSFIMLSSALIVDGSLNLSIYWWSGELFKQEPICLDCLLLSSHHSSVSILSQSPTP